MLLAAISLHLLCSTLEQPIAKFAACLTHARRHDRRHGVEGSAARVMS
jgi:hypothetical protein